MKAREGGNSYPAQGPRTAKHDTPREGGRRAARAGAEPPNACTHSTGHDMREAYCNKLQAPYSTQCPRQQAHRAQSKTRHTTPARDKGTAEWREARQQPSAGHVTAAEKKINTYEVNVPSR